MGLLMPRESEVVKNFNTISELQGVKAATDRFYELSKCSNYIRMDRINKNLYWTTKTDYGDMEITVNLSKPEKDPKEIAAAKLKPQSKYPKCLLCLENVGYAGHINHPARQNHRVIPLTLDESAWYFQYSPYVYYNEHCIIFNENHVPMKISANTFQRLFDFVKQFPHYFIGSNADLPIVGGSILSHDHFQGGRHVFPMETAPIELEFENKDFPEIKAGIVKWPMSVIRLSGKCSSALIDFSNNILEAWRKYSDADNDILAFSNVNGEEIPHNTLTPIARINKNGEYEIDLVLRNNRTSELHPDGIFHPHKELHHIKKENIGLIEVMGLAVLPGRLQNEMKAVEGILTGETAFNGEINPNDNLLYKHNTWIISLVEKYGTHCNENNAHEIVKDEVGKVFLQVLMDSGVYKKNDKGLKGFSNFMTTLGFNPSKPSKKINDDRRIKMDTNIVEEFKKIYGDEGSKIRVFHSPGRVNLIGEHTDYNGGYVFPCALDFGTFAAIRKLDNSNKCYFASTNFDLKVEASLSDLVYKKEDDWANYPKGILKLLMERGTSLSGFQVLFQGNIPNGSGLSSSASLELAIAVAINEVYNLKIDMLDLVKLAQKSENTFNGVNCGIMDQFAVGMGKANKAMFLKCDTIDYQYVPLELGDNKLVIANTNKRRGLADSKYNERRSQCDEALKYLQKELDVQNLGQVSLEQFADHKHLIPDEILRKRAKHVITEDYRVLNAIKALENNDLFTFGQLMVQSHDSLRYDYEVTGVELDTLVEEALKLDCVIGSRMTGAGFGGCTVSIVKGDCIDEFTEKVTENYTEKIGYAPTIYVAGVGDGTKEIL